MQAFLNEAQDARVAMLQMVKEAPNVRFEYPLHGTRRHGFFQGSQGVMSAAPGPESKGFLQEVRLINRLKQSLLHLQYAERSSICRLARFRDIYAPDWRHSLGIAPAGR